MKTFKDKVDEAAQQLIRDGYMVERLDDRTGERMWALTAKGVKYRDKLARARKRRTNG
jgi:hypothetical protein